MKSKKSNEKDQNEGDKQIIEKTNEGQTTEVKQVKNQPEAIKQQKRNSKLKESDQKTSEKGKIASENEKPQDGVDVKDAKKSPVEKKEKAGVNDDDDYSSSSYYYYYGDYVSSDDEEEDFKGEQEDRSD